MIEVNSWDGRERSVRLVKARITCSKCRREGNPKVKARRAGGKERVGLYCSSCGRWQMWISRWSSHCREFLDLREGRAC